MYLIFIASLSLSLYNLSLLSWALEIRIHNLLCYFKAKYMCSNSTCKSNITFSLLCAVIMLRLKLLIMIFQSKLIHFYSPCNYTIPTMVVIVFQYKVYYHQVPIQVSHQLLYRAVAYYCSRRDFCPEFVHWFRMIMKLILERERDREIKRETEGENLNHTH